MGIQCPKCAAELEHDFGLVNCPGCGILLSIDFDGKAVESKEEFLQQASQPADQSAPAFLDENTNPGFQLSPENNLSANLETDQNQMISPEINQEFNQGFNHDAGGMTALNSPIKIDFENQFEQDPSSDLSEKTGSFNLNDLEPKDVIETKSDLADAEVYSDEKTSDVVIEPEETVGQRDMHTEQDLSQIFDEPLDQSSQAYNSGKSLAEEVSSYGNSEASDSGPISYSFVIDGIDLGQTKSLVEEALNHPKFRWRASDIMQGLNQGRLKLENVNPAKASMLVRRLSGIKVKVYWRQNVYS